MTRRFGLRPMLVGLLVAMACSAPATTPSAAPDGSAGSSTTAETLPWGWEAEVWLAALADSVGEQGGRAWRYFLDPHVVWDSSSVDPEAEVQRGGEVVTTLAVLIPRESGATRREAAFLDREGVVILNRFDWTPANLNWTPLRATPAQLVQILSPIGVNGATNMVSAMAVDSWRERIESRDDLDAAEAIAHTWLDVRSGAAPVEALYAPDATITDSIAGVSAQGHEAIRALVRAESTNAWGTVSVGAWEGDPEDRETVAIYPVTSEVGVLEAVVVVVVGDDGNRCPGSMAVVLDVSDGQVQRAQRYWDLDRARTCLPPESLPDGWWLEQALVFDDRYVPYEDLVTPTGSVTADGVEVEMINSTDALDALIQWALLRFDEAGIGLPDVRSIRFSEFDQSCHGINGRTEFDAGTADLLLCYHEHDLFGSERWSRTELDCQHIVLHELSHVWMRQNLDEADRTAFIESVGLQTWIDGDVMPWQEQAREVAAETMAWGLLDEPMIMYKIGAPDIETLRSGFELLTGRPPLQPAAS